MASNSVPPVVITRPLAQAEPLAQRVRQLGHDAIVFPLLEIHPLPDPAALRAALAHLRDYAMAAFVSPNAIDAALALIPAWPLEVAIAVIGEGSRAALGAHGITSANARIVSPRDTKRTDSQTLLEALDVTALRSRRVLVIRGESGRELLADALRAQGVHVDQVAAYRRAAPVLDAGRTNELRSLLDAGATWLITSSEAVRNLIDMTSRAAGDEGVAKLQRHALVVPHARIAESAHALGFQHVVLTGSGDEQLVAALQSRA
jgi:uroporphyrinogen-III synthase